MDPRVIAFVLAGGQGLRLRPLTTNCPKPVLPFGGRYRLIDFVLSNLYNSGVSRALVLLQHKPHIVHRHLTGCWRGVSRAGGDFARALRAEGAYDTPFHGTADAVGKSLAAAEVEDCDVIAVFAADHVYRMDVGQMVRAHLESGADATVAALPVPVESASSLGVISCDPDSRIRGFSEKPAKPQTIPGDPRRAYASMGNYLFRPRVLREALEAARDRGEHDFGSHVLPRLVDTHRVFAYDFRGNVIPQQGGGASAPYWRDVGTVDSYAQAHWDVLGPEPLLNLDDPAWPIRHSSMRGLAYLPEHSIVAPDARLQGARLRQCVVYSGACVGEKADLARCILMPGAVVGGGVILRDAIVGAGSVITASRDFARPRSAQPTPWLRSPGGILVMPPRQLAGVHSDALH